MVSEREVKRVVKELNSDIQWEQEARLQFSMNVGLLMHLFAQKVEECRNNNRRRITPETVEIAFARLIKNIISGEEE